MTRTRTPRSIQKKARDALGAKARLAKKEDAAKDKSRQQVADRRQREYNARKSGTKTTIEMIVQSPVMPVDPPTPAFRHA